MNTDKIFAEAIANEYAPKDTSKVVALRKLDWKAKRAATLFAYGFGIGMALVLGLGMCLSMQVIGGGRRPDDGRRNCSGRSGHRRRGPELSHLQEASPDRQRKVRL